ncbi:Na+/H+ antiporter subunit E [Thalassotalea sp. PS06]|uniref:Na+/H+ antiporter subunit E n=1 Tax=Thalassotalea sp. PS06 TaxID=2594005 RepID=UPI0011653652|nr:Na+/H+ antiporter subunit E [Thalassotalea sp. PS06]QDP00203.1 cation transporter [Thalassotalea sp. PS06]
MERKTIINLVIWTVTLAVFWLLLSGYLKPLLLGFGLASVAVVVFLIWRMDNTDKEPQKLTLNPRFYRYLVWLIGQVVVSSLEVAKLVWGSAKNLSPATAKLPITDIPKNSRVLYANSITMTPGTLSVDIDDKHVTVHALDEESIKSLQEGEMASRITKATGEKN